MTQEQKSYLKGQALGFMLATVIWMGVIHHLVMR